MNNILSKRTLIALIVLIAVALLVGLVPPRELPRRQAEETTGPYQVTLIGNIVCLPHKDTSGPTTLECAYGVQTLDGIYYALDMSVITLPIDEISFDQTVYIEGLYTPVDKLSTNQWDIYNINGVVQATSIVPVEGNL